MAESSKNSSNSDKSSDAKIIEWVKSHKIYTIIGVIVVVAIITISSVSVIVGHKAKEQQSSHVDNAAQALINRQNSNQSIADGTDVTLLSAQKALIKRFGEPPKGYILNWDGKLIPKGIKKMTAEQVAYSYLKALSTLDMATAQKYSRDASIVSDYESYFDTATAKSSTTVTEYQQNIFKASMLSMQIESLGDATAFANDKQTFTAKIKMLDLYTTSFLDGGTMNQLEKGISDRGGITSDDSQGAKYLQSWLLNKYQSPDAPMTTIEATITVQKYPDLNTGWLVSIDKPLNDKFKIQMDQGAYYYVKSDILGIS